MGGGRVVNDIEIVLCPGSVISKNDGQRHYINARKLAMLYEVDYSTCVIYDPSKPESLSFKKKENQVFLCPREDGNYKRFEHLLRENYVQD